MSQLPSIWAEASIGSVCVDTEQVTPNADAEFIYVDIASVDRDTKTITSPQRLLGKDAPSRARKLIKAGDTIVSTTRPNLNAVALVDQKLDGQIASTGFDVLRAPGLDPRWLGYLVRTSAFVDAMSSLVQGALYPAIRGKDVRSFVAPIAPVKEQKRIADKLDTVLTRVDAVNTRLARVAPLLKRFRQSVLAAATSGRLTEDWRQEKYSFDKGQELEWSDTTLRSCISSMSGGASPSVDVYSAEGVLALNKGDIKLYGHLASKKNQNRVPEIYATQHNNKIVRTGELLVTLRDLSSKADFLGLIAQYINAEVALPTQGMYKLNVNPNTNRKYLMYFSNSPAYREIMKREKVGATQVHLRNDQFLDIPIALPPMAEQTEIVRRVETLFAFADRLETRLAQAQTAATRLTPALLAKAFRGDLVPQDPNDEPAAELLRRLAQANPATGVAKRERKRNASKTD